MSNSDKFDPNRARQVVIGGEVENVDWAEARDASAVINALNTLGEMGKGTNPDDFKNLARFLNPKAIFRLRDIAKHYYDNLAQLAAEQEKPK